MSVSHNGLGSVLVSWIPPSSEPAVTGYIIYYQHHGGLRLSQTVEATTTSITASGLIAGTYSITIVATSSTLPSNESAAKSITIGIHINSLVHVLGVGNNKIILESTCTSS